MPIVAVRPRVLAALGALVLPGSAQVIRLRIQKRVQRLLDRRPYHLRPGAPGCAPHRSGPPAPAAASSTPAGSTPASMVGSIVHASEVSLPLLVPTSKHKTRIKCARNSLRYPMQILFAAEALPETLAGIVIGTGICAWCHA